MIVEETTTGWSAWLPDLPGCVATGPTRETVEREMSSAAEFHLEGLRESGELPPCSNAYARVVDLTG